MVRNLINERIRQFFVNITNHPDNISKYEPLSVQVTGIFTETYKKPETSEN
jgi:hypothetical protein